MMNEVKSLNLPANVPVGVAIGKNGKTVKWVERNFEVKVKVDIPNRRVSLKGTRAMVVQAEDHLVKLFENFSIGRKPKPYIFMYMGIYGLHESNWKFVSKPLSETEVYLNSNLQGMNYILTSVPVVDCNTDKTPVIVKKPKWASNLDNREISNLVQKVQKYMDPEDEDERVKVKMAFGMIRFKLLIKENQVYDCHQLNSLDLSKDLKTCFSSTTTGPKIMNLMKLLRSDDLDQERQESRLVVKVIISDTKSQSKYTIKYHYHECVGKWQVKDLYDERKVFGLLSFRIDDETWVRTRFYSRKNTDDPNVKVLAEKHVIITDPNDDYQVKASLSEEGLKLGYRIDEQIFKRKKHIELLGIKFSLYFYNYNDDQEIPSIEARLSKPRSTPSESFEVLMGKLFDLF